MQTIRMMYFSEFEFILAYVYNRDESPSYIIASACTLSLKTATTFTTRADTPSVAN